MELIALTALFLVFVSFREWMHKGEKVRLLDQIDELENKLIESSMARDLTEYAHARRDMSGETAAPIVTEPEFLSESDLDSDAFLKMIEKKENPN